VREMATKFAVTPEEVDELVSRVKTFEPSKYPGMSYEQGVEEALRWVLEGEEFKPDL
jgi:hypothetical protein